jgi:hypothetical protein
VDGSFWQPTEGGGWTSSSDPDLPEPSHFGAVLAAGLYRVRFERDGRQPIEVDASVVVGRTTDVDVRLDE